MKPAEVPSYSLIAILRPFPTPYSLLPIPDCFYPYSPLPTPYCVYPAAESGQEFER